MEKLIFSVKKLSKDAVSPLPLQNLGYEIFSPSSFEIEPFSMGLVYTDLSLTYPAGYVGHFRTCPKTALFSGTQICGDLIVNELDENVCLVIYNFSEKKYKISKGDSLAILTLIKSLAPIMLCTNSSAESSSLTRAMKVLGNQ